MLAKILIAVSDSHIHVVRPGIYLVNPSSEADSSVTILGIPILYAWSPFGSL